MSGTETLGVAARPMASPRPSPKIQAKHQRKLSTSTIGFCRALYAYSKVEESELSLAVGQLIEIKFKDEEWWFGESRGESGWFPEMYVETADQSAVIAGGFSTSDSNRSSFDRGSVDFSHASSGKEREKEKERDLTPVNESDDELELDQDLIRASVRNGRPYEALYTHRATEPDELSMKEGERFLLLEESGDGWCLAAVTSCDWTSRGLIAGIGKHVGWMPLNYLKELPFDPAEAAPDEPSEDSKEEEEAESALEVVDEREELAADEQEAVKERDVFTQDEPASSKPKRASITVVIDLRKFAKDEATADDDNDHASEGLDEQEKDEKEEDGKDDEEEGAEAQPPPATLDEEEVEGGETAAAAVEGTTAAATFTAATAARHSRSSVPESEEVEREEHNRPLEPRQTSVLPGETPEVSHAQIVAAEQHAAEEASSCTVRTAPSIVVAERSASKAILRVINDGQDTDHLHPEQQQQ